MQYFGIRFLKGSTVVRVFMDSGWERRAEAAGLVPGREYDTMQVLSREKCFDEWVPYAGHQGSFRAV
jgi:hypothetical protein